MSLRKQLLAFGLLTLVLPWAGYRVVQEMESALRSGLEQALLASAGTVAATLDDEPILRQALTGASPYAAVEATIPQSYPQPAAGLPSDHSNAIGPGQVPTGDPLLVPRAEASERTAAPEVASNEPAGAINPTAIYATPLAEEPRIDGLLDEQAGQPDPGTTLSGDYRYWAGIHGRYLSVYVEARDSDIVYEGPPGETPYGDRLAIALTPYPGVTNWLLFTTRAPGTFRAQQTTAPLFKPSGEYEARVIAAWRETAEGYAIEVRLPLTLVGNRIGITLIDVDRSATGYAVNVQSTWDDQGSMPGLLIYEKPELKQLLGRFGQPGSRFRIVTTQGWVVADEGSVRPGVTSVPTTGLGDRLFSIMLRRDDPPYAGLEPRPGRLSDQALTRALEGSPATAWFADGPAKSAIVAAAVPVRSGNQMIGAVLLEQASDPILTLANRALLRLMMFTLLAAFVAAAGLFGYATWLSIRVQRLARAAETALGPKGEIDAHLPGRRAGDEIGDLARSFGRMLERLREHTQYLKTLASKLSHELRTPLAVVSTSLDNLEQEVTGEAARPYLDRLRHGAVRLDAILAAMGEATRLEQAIDGTVPERYDLSAVVDACCKTYVDVYPQRQFVWNISAVRAEVVGSAELTAQLIDKLIDNAVDFSADGSTIDIRLDDTGSDLRLQVANQGPSLPKEMRGRLFDSLVSVRTRDDGQSHLGLGLHIVSLIARFHGGHATADDLPDLGGVVFSVWYPHAPRPKLTRPGTAG